MTTVRCRIVRSAGMGGFLNPPGHPEHTAHVETDCHRRPEHRGGCSLSYAASQEWVDAETRAEAKYLLDRWQTSRPTLDSPAVREWILQCLGYFRNCYRNPDVEVAREVRS